MVDVDLVAPLIAFALRRYRNDARALRRTLTEFEAQLEVAATESAKTALRKGIDALRERIGQLELPIDRERGP